MRLEDRVALVIGGSEGVGRAISVGLAREGARVMVASRHEKEGQDVTEAIENAGGDVGFARVDLTDEDSVQTLIGDVILRYGALHALVNVAPITMKTDAILLNTNQWDETLNRSLRGPWLACKYAVPFMKQSGGGTIVNVIGTHASATLPRHFVHATVDGAILGMTRSLAIDLGPHNIRVNALCLGWIETPETEAELREASDPERAFRRAVSIHPLGRVGTMEEAAQAAVFLVSSGASFVSGTGIVVDGGRSAAVQELYDW